MENEPLKDGVQRKEEDKEWLIGIFRIYLTQEGVNKEMRRERFQESLEIKSETIKSGNKVMLNGREAEEKKGKVGIQEEFQTERAEELWILWQAPRYMIGFDLRMPFQNQEERQREKGERKELDWRYLPERCET